MATKKVAPKGLNTAASHDRNPTDVKPAVQATPFTAPNGKPAAVPASVPPHLQPKPAAKPLDQVKKAVKASPRKETLASVKATSSKEQTEKTIPYVLLRKATKPGAKPTRSIVNFITVGNTVEPHHVRSIRVAIINGDAYGTNYNVVGSGATDIRKARFFDYSRSIMHNKSAKSVQPWDFGNEQAIRALEKLGAISKYDLEFHLEETKRRKQYNDSLEQAKAKALQHKQDVSKLKDLAKRIAKEQGNYAVRQALRSAVPNAL